jgi:electron transport complex protein RnfE
MNNKCTERLFNGIVKENPTFVLMLGMCPTLAVTTSAVNGVGMGLSTTVVLLFSNMIISAMRKIIPDRVRIPAYIVIVATLVTIVQLLLQAYVPSLYSALGIYIPLIVVNCIILGRAESYASKNGVVESTFDGIGMGLGFTIALTCIGLVREILGSGAIFGHTIIPESYHISIFVLAPGAFFVLSILTALQNKFKAPSATNGSAPQSKLACGGNCMSCTGSSCMSNHEVLDTRKRQAEEDALVAKKAEVARKEAELKTATSKKDE